jgi:integrase
VATIEAFRDKYGNLGVTTLKRHNIETMLAAIPKPGAKRHWLTCIRHLLQAAVPTMRRDNPTDGIAKVKLPKSGGYHSWSDAEIQLYRNFWALGTQQRLLFEFCLESASRKGEVVRLGPQHIKDGRIRIARSKGSRDVDILMSPELQAAVDAMPKEHLTFLVTERGKPRSKYGLGNDFRRWADKAGLPKCCSLHGLKKAGMRRLVDVGANAHELMGVSGHKSLSEAQRYTEDFDRKAAADRAMAKRKARA